MKKYSIGLDIGTDSVGWACVDENDQLIKHGRKTLWGVRMFEASKDASERDAFTLYIDSFESYKSLFFTCS